MTSICGLGQVALGPVLSVLGMERGGAAAREHPEGPRRHRDLTPSGMAGREFFAVRTVAETLGGFRPARRTAIETVALAGARGRVPAEPVRAPHDLPGFAKLDRRRIRRPGGRHLRGVRGPAQLPRRRPAPSPMGRAPEVAVARGHGGGDADRRRDPRRRRRGRHGRVHAGGDAGHDRGRTTGGAGRRPGASRRGCGARRRPRAGRTPAAATGPRPARVGGRDGGRASTRGRAWRSCRPATRSSTPAARRSRRVRCATRARSRSRPSSATRAASPPCSASSPTTGSASPRCCATRSPRSDVVVVSAGSSVGARDETAAAVAGPGRAGDLGPRDRASGRASRRCSPTAAASR